MIARSVSINSRNILEVLSAHDVATQLPGGKLDQLWCSILMAQRNCKLGKIPARAYLSEKLPGLLTSRNEDSIELVLKLVNRYGNSAIEVLGRAIRNLEDLELDMRVTFSRVSDDGIQIQNQYVKTASPSVKHSRLGVMFSSGSNGPVFLKVSGSDHVNISEFEGFTRQMQKIN